uniref:Uncharacterized protein n=1 Tax=Ciona savignyi TaxID=51511 RepID=H2YQS6_CIOSA
MDQSNVLKDNQFQCKTEKVDFGFGGDATSNNNASNNQQQYFNPEMQSNPMFNNQAPSYNEKTSSPFTHSTMTQQSISMNQQQNVNSGNGQMTSQHIHRLSVSVNSKFNVMQKQQQPHNGMNNNRTPSNENEPMRTTPDAPPRLSHPPSANMAKSVSPSPVSYSVTHQPHPGLNSIPNGQTNGGPYFSSAMQNAPMTGSMPQNPNLQRAPRMPIQGTPSYMNQRGGNAGITMGPGINSGMGPAPPNPTGMSKAQQLKELAEKRGPAGINNQWSASASASVNMSSSMSYNGQSLNQRDHMSADMQSFSSFQNSNVNNVSQSQVNMQSNNYMAASVAAQAAVAASHRQQQHPPDTQGSRLSHFNNLEGNFQPQPRHSKPKDDGEIHVQLRGPNEPQPDASSEVQVHAEDPTPANYAGNSSWIRNGHTRTHPWNGVLQSTDGTKVLPFSDS